MLSRSRRFYAAMVQYGGRNIRASLACLVLMNKTSSICLYLQMQNHLKYELYNVLSGKSAVRFGAIIQTIAGYLNDGEKTSPIVEDEKQNKKQETERLKDWISKNKFWIEVDVSQYVSEGAEQKVYLKDSENVLKLNDAIYYLSWKDYLYNLLLHNYFFPDTAYKLIGFTLIGEVLYAVVQQSFVAITNTTDLIQVKRFLNQNGFVNQRNNDYFNPDLGIILEDLHDENVLTKNDILYFIDTVFYLTDSFWKQ